MPKDYYMVNKDYRNEIIRAIQKGKKQKGLKIQ